MDLLEYGGSLIQSLLTELLSTAIAIPLVTYLVLKFFQNFRSARIWDVSGRLRQVFRPRPYPTLVLSTSSIYSGDARYSRPQTGIGQIRSLALFGSSLSRAYRADPDDRRILLSHECRISQGELTEDLIVIGGPKTNEIGLLLLKELAPRLPEGFSFAPETVSIRGKDTHTFALRFEGRLLQPSNDDEVVGLVLRTSNPLSPERTLTYVAGLGTYGTEAAARALLECTELHRPAPLTFRWWKWRFGGRPNAYLAIIRANLTGNQADSTTRSAVSPRVVNYTRLAS